MEAVEIRCHGTPPTPPNHPQVTHATLPLPLNSRTLRPHTHRLTPHLLYSQNEDIRPSSDAGHYLCDFTYYTSLVEYWRRNPEGERPVMFFHVPGGAEEKDVERGRRVALGLIAALVANWRRGRERGV
jgi:hypothetical protein